MPRGQRRRRAVPITPASIQTRWSTALHAWMHGYSAATTALMLHSAHHSYIFLYDPAWLQGEIGKGAFQELDQVAAVQQFCKYAGRANSPGEIAAVVTAAVKVRPINDLRQLPLLLC